jgi:outer membrane lipopolysaccharide assembly protein LptE/RlpB
MIKFLQIVLCTRHQGRFILAVFAFCILWTSLSGCGYHCAERIESLPPWIKTVYVAPLANRSNELLLGVWITEELRHEFLRGRGLKLVPKDEADVILEGEIVSTSTSGLSYIRYDQAVERRITAEYSVHLVCRESGKVIWQTSNIAREEEFLVGKDVMQTEGLKGEALQKLSRDVAEIIYHRITGVF